MIDSIVAGLVVALVNVIGGGLVIRWLVRQINALKGTVAAQDATLKTIGEVNRTVLEVFRAMDPQRWAKEVQIHKRFADEKAQAIIEDERRKYEREKEETARRGKDAVAFLFEETQRYIGAIIDLMPYVPKETRQSVLKEMRVSEHIRRILTEVADRSPDWSQGFRSLPLADIARAALELPPPPPAARERLIR